MSLAKILQTKRLVLRLYGRCIRAAQKCPDFQQRNMMMEYTRSRFRGDNTDPRDIIRIEKLLKQGEEEVVSMEYYHKVREDKQTLTR